MANNTSHHILNSAATLLGFCLFVITSFHVNNKSQNSVVDEFTSVVALFLTWSCIFSFFSIRTNNEARCRRLEGIAEYLFIASLIGIFVIISFISLKLIQ